MNLAQLHRENTVVSSTVSERYAPVSTELILKPFLERGWHIHKQLGSGLGKQVTELRSEGYKMPNGDYLSLWTTNSFNGSCAFSFYAGYGRLVCDNGLVIGDIEGGRFIHNGTKIYDRLEQQYDKIVAHLENLMEGVGKLKVYEPSPTQVNEALIDIAKSTFEVDTKSRKIEVIDIKDTHRILRARRIADYGQDAFTLLNVVQENIVRKGFLKVTVRETNKETGIVSERVVSKRPCEDKITSVKINSDISKAFLKIVA